MGTNSRRARAKFLEPEDCALDEALYAAQRHTQNAAETQQPKPDDSHPTAGSISIGCSSRCSSRFSILFKIIWLYRNFFCSIRQSFDLIAVRAHR